MNILYLLIGVSLLAALSFLVLFIWAVRTGQYEDTFTPSVRILFEDENEEKTQNITNDKAK
jgi:cbb3-type cytochrome oxidase maturation protein